MTRLTAPFPWFGGKSLAASAIWARLGSPINYVEPFAGSLAVLLGRPGGPGTCETVNDRDGFICNFWRAIVADPERVAHEADWPVIESDLHARHFRMAQARAHLTALLEGDPSFYDPRLAGWWVWGISVWIGGSFCELGSGPWTVEDGLFQRAGESAGVRRSIPCSDRKGITRKQPTHHRKGIVRQVPAYGRKGATRQTDMLRWIQALAERLRYVRVCCGDWSRVMAVNTIARRGPAGVVLDPPYSFEVGRNERLYGATEDGEIAHQVRGWCLEHGGHPFLRIALCGYEGEHTELEEHGWTTHRWVAHGGMAHQARSGESRGQVNRARETIWFSPACLPVEPNLFEEVGESA